MSYTLTLKIDRLDEQRTPVGIADVAGMESGEPAVIAATLRAVANQLDPPKPATRLRQDGPRLRGQRSAEPSAAAELRALRDLGVTWTAGADGLPPHESQDFDLGTVATPLLAAAQVTRDRYLTKRRGEAADRRNAELRAADPAASARIARDERRWQDEGRALPQLDLHDPMPPGGRSA